MSGGVLIMNSVHHVNEEWLLWACRCFDYERYPSRPWTVNTDFYERVSLKGNTSTLILSTVGYALFPLPSDGLRGRIMNGVHHVPEHRLLWACITEGKYLYSNSLFVLLLLLMSYMGFILILVFYMIYEGMRESSPRSLPWIRESSPIHCLNNIDLDGIRNSEWIHILREKLLSHICFIITIGWFTYRYYETYRQFICIYTGVYIHWHRK